MILNATSTNIPLRSETVQLCCFSPPYWGLRKYDGLPELVWGDAWRGDLGLEPTPELYLDHMMMVMGEVWRVLRDNGVCFVNIGDSYATNVGKGNNVPQTKWAKNRYPESAAHRSRDIGIRPKSLCLIPQKFAIRCQEAGWIIRSEIIWAKPNPMPESVKDRPTRSHEQVWMMTKLGRYYWDKGAVSEPVAESTIGRGAVDFGGAKGRNYIPLSDDPNFRNGSEQWGRTFDYKESCKNGRNTRTVWTIATEPTSDCHFASWPTKLVEKFIRAASKPGDIVLDCFCGTGKTVVEAERLNRVGIGLDLSKKYLSEIATVRISKPLQRELI